jgi:hypothetical protein
LRFLTSLVLIMAAEIVHSISHLLPTHQGHIQQVIRGQDNRQATRRGIIGVKYLVTFPEERTYSEVAVRGLLGDNFSLSVDFSLRFVHFRRTIKRKLLAYPIPVGGDFRQGRGSHGDERSIPALEVAEIGDIVYTE